MLPEFDFLESGLMVEIVRKQLKQSRGQQMQDQFTSDYSYNPSALTPQFYPSLRTFPSNSQEINHIFVHNPLFQSFLTEHLNSGIAEPEEIGCLEDIERILRE